MQEQKDNLEAAEDQAVAGQEDELNVDEGEENCPKR
jgi:hypothetical protein